MRTFRTPLGIGMTFLTGLLVAGCSSESAPPGADSAPAEQLQPVVNKQPENGMWRLPDPRDGVLQVVICRASNIGKVAADRRDASRANDLFEQLQTRLEGGIASALIDHRDEYGNVSAFDIVGFFDAEIHKAAEKATYANEELVKLDDALYAAYVLAEIKHDEINSALADRADIYAARRGWDAPTFREFLRGVVAQLRTGVAGNEHYVATDN